MTKLKEALQEMIIETKGLIGHPDFSSDIEQNAAFTLLQRLEYLDSIAEYEEVKDPGDVVLLPTPKNEVLQTLKELWTKINIFRVPVKLRTRVQKILDDNKL